MINSSYHRNSKEHLEIVLTFLKEEDWIYNYPNTHILVNKVLDNFQQEWLPYLKNIENAELNYLPSGVVNEYWPASLKLFVSKIQDLKYEIQKWKSTSKIIELPDHCCISKKKRHEVVSLAAVIHDLCEQQNISFVIDIGAGLGYLSQLLYSRYNYRVLGIEGNQKNMELALKYQEKFYPDSKNFVKYAHHFITERSVIDIETFANEYFSDGQGQVRACITGLHACADLSVIILNIFTQLNFVQSLIIMPCCYHRLDLQHATASAERFKNFPASNVLTTLHNDLKGEIFMKRPFLRLACQQSCASWRMMSVNDHEKHSRSCIFRAIVQEVADKDNLDVKRLKRKTGKFKPGADYNIEEYIDKLKYTHELVPREACKTDSNLIDDPAFKSKIREKWNEHKENCYLVEILTAFQTAIQSICENVVLLDRVEFLREKGFECNVYKVTDDHISPRCHALVATKL